MSDGLMDAKVLRRAAELVLQGWTQRTCAVDESGRGVLPCSPHAAAWCAHGAVTRAMYDLGDESARNASYGVTTRLYNAVVAVCPTDSLLEWNDTPGRTADQVAETFCAAADRCEARERLSESASEALTD